MIPTYIQERNDALRTLKVNHGGYSIRFSKDDTHRLYVECTNSDGHTNLSCYNTLSEAGALLSEVLSALLEYVDEIEHDCDG